VQLEVFDLLGRRVAVLVDAPYEPGRYSITWDRRGTKGSRLPAGVYTCRYTAGDHHELKRIIVFP
jgi:flagellar hook assembly protein FlgD